MHDETRIPSTDTKKKLENLGCIWDKSIMVQYYAHQFQSQEVKLRYPAPQRQKVYKRCKKKKKN